MTAGPLFSVVVPAYQAEQTIGAAVRSALAQTVVELEVVVVDDGSTDGTADAVREIDDARVQLRRQPNAGPSAARNAALRVARGRYATFLDADDLLLPTYLETMRVTFEQRPDAGVVDCPHWLLDDRTGQVSPPPASGVVPLPEQPDAIFRRLLDSNLVWGTTTVPTRLLAAVGGWRETLRACTDYELWLRILAFGRPVVRVGEPLVVWRRTGDTLCADPLLMTRMLCEVYRLVAEEYDVPDDLRALALARLETERRTLGALTGERPFAARALRLKGRLGRVKRAALRPRRAGEFPEVVARAFPELARRG